MPEHGLFPDCSGKTKYFSGTVHSPIVATNGKEDRALQIDFHSCF